MSEVLATIWSTIVQDFTDVSGIPEVTRIVLRLSMAAVLGGAVGYERERRGKDAGLRTHMLVAIGAAIFVLAPLESGMELGDMSRVMQGVIAGIGFLGAGAIIKLDRDQTIRGLTTAASIWVAAGVGLAAGMGLEVTAVVSTAIAIFVLAVLRRLEQKMEVASPEPD